MTICALTFGEVKQFPQPPNWTVISEESNLILPEPVLKNQISLSTDQAVQSEVYVNTPGKYGESQRDFSGERAKDGGNGSNLTVILKTLQDGNIAVTVYRDGDFKKPFKKEVLRKNGTLTIDTEGGSGGDANSNFETPELIPEGAHGGNGGNIQVFAIDQNAKSFLDRGYFSDLKSVYPSFESPEQYSLRVIRNGGEPGTVFSYRARQRGNRGESGKIVFYDASHLVSKSDSLQSDFRQHRIIRRTDPDYSPMTLETH
jgi:hypothetical protein